jgi:SAM-dependent methyltransferase
MSRGMAETAGAYDDQMRRRLVDEYYGQSEFFNYGYWRADTRDQREACANLMEKLLDFVPDKTGRALDVACGMGATTRHLLKHYRPASLVGINISLRQLERSRLNAPGCAFQLMDAARLGFADHTFDQLLCVEAAFHFETRERFVREAHRVLKPGGCLLLSDMLFKRGKWNRYVPDANLVTDLKQYRQVYLRAGFREVEIVDATRECWGGFRRHLTRWVWSKLRTGEINLRTWWREMLRVWARQLVTTHYLLVSARKA